MLAKIDHCSMAPSEAHWMGVSEFFIGRSAIRALCPAYVIDAVGTRFRGLTIAHNLVFRTVQPN